MTIDITELAEKLAEQLHNPYALIDCINISLTDHSPVVDNDKIKELLKNQEELESSINIISGKPIIKNISGGNKHTNIFINPCIGLSMKELVKIERDRLKEYNEINNSANNSLNKLPKRVYKNKDENYVKKYVDSSVLSGGKLNIVTNSKRIARVYPYTLGILA